MIIVILCYYNHHHHHHHHYYCYYLLELIGLFWTFWNWIIIFNHLFHFIIIIVIIIILLCNNWNLLLLLLLLLLLFIPSCLLFKLRLMIWRCTSFQCFVRLFKSYPADSIDANFSTRDVDQWTTKEEFRSAIVKLISFEKTMMKTKVNAISATTEENFFNNIVQHLLTSY